MARAVEQITSLARVQVEEDPRNDDHALFETSLEEVEAVGNSGWEPCEVEPEVEGRVWNSLYDKAYLAKTFDDKVTLLLHTIG